MRLTLAHCDFAGRVLTLAMKEGLLSGRKYHELMSSVRRHERRLTGCEGKAQFLNFALADRVAKRLGRHDDDHGYRRPYACDVCHHYHLAEKTAAQRRAEEGVLEQRKARGWDDEELAGA